MSFSETIFLFFLALIIFGPKKLPEIARQVGKALNEFRRASNEFKAQIEQEIANLEVENRRQTILPPSPAPEGTASRTSNAETSEPSQASAASPDGGVTETSPAETSAMQAASEDEPLFATAPAVGEPPAAEGTPATEVVPTSTSQESHA